MRKGYRYRIYPDKVQVGRAENMFSMCRHLYNWNLDERIEAYEDHGLTVTYYDQANKLPQLKQERPWYKGVDAQVLQDVLRRLDKAYKSFFREQNGFPKPKKYGQWSSITYPQFTARPSGGKLTIPKLGEVKIKYHRNIPAEAKLKTLSVIKEGGKWFVSFSVELPAPPEPKPDINYTVGMDLGLIDFLTFDDGSPPIQRPRHLKRLAGQIKRIQRRLAQHEKRSVAYLKDLRILQKLWYRVRCWRQAFVHEAVNHVLEKGDVLIHEDLNIRSMMTNSDHDKYGSNRLHESIADACWGEFLRVLQYKAAEQSKTVIAVPPAYTSQMCSSCGILVMKSLSTRTHCCTSCGYVAGRDENAAKNIRRLGLQSTGLMAQEAPAIASA